jgi:hypothetical protein
MHPGRCWTSRPTAARGAEARPPGRCRGVGLLPQHRGLGARERHTLAETTYAVLRQRLLWQHLAQGKQRSGAPGAPAGHPGLAGQRGLPARRAGPARAGLAGRGAGHRPRHLPEKLRHNLPDWLAGALRGRAGRGVLAAGARHWRAGAAGPACQRALKAKREDVQRSAGRGRHHRRAHAVLALGPAHPGQAGAESCDAVHRGGRGAGRRQPAAGAAGGRQARRDGGGLLCRRRRQDAGAGRDDAQHRAAVCLRRVGPPAGGAQAAPGAQRPVQRATRRRSPTSATTASSAWPARSTACWWTRPARAWARCAATRT